MTKKERAKLVQQKLAERYPHPETHLDAKDPWELTIATVLATQCTDKRVNMVTPHLFARWPGPAELGQADVADVEEVIKSTGFYHNKAKNIVAAGKRVAEVYGGRVPCTMEELITLPGIARKTANVVLWSSFGINEGLAVDTHVGRISYRLGLTAHKDPVKVEQDLMALFPKAEWGNVNHRMVWFGRNVCDAKKPLCNECEMAEFCPKVEFKKS